MASSHHRGRVDDGSAGPHNHHAEPGYSGSLSTGLRFRWSCRHGTRRPSRTHSRPDLESGQTISIAPASDCQRRMSFRPLSRRERRRWRSRCARNHLDGGDGLASRCRVPRRPRLRLPRESWARCASSVSVLQARIGSNGFERPTGERLKTLRTNPLRPEGTSRPRAVEP